MPSMNLNGQPVPSLGNGWTEGSPIWCYAELPTARVASNGSRPVVITSLKLYVSGQDASRSVRLFVADTGGANEVKTAAFTVAAASSGQSTGFRSLTKGFLNSPGAQARFGFTDTSGFVYFGRSPDTGTVYDPYGNYDNATLSGTYNYAEVPAAPSTPNGTAGVGSASLSWTAPTDNGGAAITGYLVEWSTSSSFTSPGTTKTTGTSVTITGLANGTTYYFRVAARNSVSDTWSLAGPWSGARSVFLAQVPGVPGGLTAARVSGDATKATVSWNAPSSDGGSAITGYQLQWAESGTAYSDTNSITQAGRSVTLTGRKIGATYNYRVRSKNAVGWSAYSSSVSLTQANVPGQVTGLVLTPQTATSATLAWTAPANNGEPITLYEVQYTGADGTTVTATSTTTNIQLDNLQPGVTYTYKVRAKNAAGYGSFSGTASGEQLSGASISDGTGTWPAAEVFVSDGSAWVRALVDESDGGTWVPAK